MKHFAQYLLAPLFLAFFALHLGFSWTYDAHAGRGKARIEGVLNLNTATLEQLMLLPRIGPKKARRILEYRKKRTKFSAPRELTRVKGIGFKTFLKLKPYLTTTQKTNIRLKN